MLISGKNGDRGSKSMLLTPKFNVCHCLYAWVLHPYMSYYIGKDDDDSGDIEGMFQLNMYSMHNYATLITWSNV